MRNGAIVGVAAVLATACGRLGFDAGDARGDGPGSVCPGVDLQIDPEHCGRCGHSCLGGACEAGTCAPRSIATGQGLLRGIVVDATHVYWIGVDVLRRAAKTGGGVEMVATFSGRGFRMIAHGDHLYWVTRDTGLVARVSRSAAGPLEVLATGQGDVGGVATDGTAVYWDTYPTGGQLYRGAIAGGAPAPMLPAARDNLTGIVLAGATLYYIEHGVGLWSLPAGGGAPTLVVPGVGTWELVIDGDDIFLAGDADGTTVVRTTRAGAPPVVLAAAMNPWGFAVDAEHLYFADEDGDRIARVPRAGGEVQVLATPPRPVGIAVDALAVYWTTYDGEVWALAK